MLVHIASLAFIVLHASCILTQDPFVLFHVDRHFVRAALVDGIQHTAALPFDVSIALYYQIHSTKSMNAYMSRFSHVDIVLVL